MSVSTIAKHRGERHRHGPDRSSVAEVMRLSRARSGSAIHAHAAWRASERRRVDELDGPLVLPHTAYPRPGHGGRLKES